VSSIRRELLLSLIGAVLIAGSIAALAVYYKAREEHGELLDYHMRQMALAIREEAHERRGVIEAPPFGFDYSIQISSDDGLRLYYARSRVRLPLATASGYARVDSADGPWRVYTLHDRGVSVQIAQPMEVRNRLAAQAALRTMAPFVLAVPLLAVLVWWGVTRGLRPLESLTADVKSRTAESLAPLPDKRVPSEIQPVVLALNDLLARLSRALETQRGFIADAAHALRSPLTALSLQLQLAERAEAPDERAAAFHALREGIDRMTRLVEQLLTLAREEPSGAHEAREAFDLGTLAADVVGLYAPLAEQKEIDLGLAQRDSDLAIDGEREAVKTLLSNVVDNALRYTPEGGRVDVVAARRESELVAEVTDNGPGIPAEDRERVFDRFYRRAGTDVPGSGLGLAIVRSIAERHGARVELDTGPDGRGLAVRVAFPRSPEKAARV
jgi:two-component system, OmpR family, sensor kinase